MVHPSVSAVALADLLVRVVRSLAGSWRAWVRGGGRVLVELQTTTSLASLTRRGRGPLRTNHMFEKLSQV